MPSNIYLINILIEIEALPKILGQSINKVIFALKTIQNMTAICIFDEL